MFALIGLSTQRAPANLPKVGPSRSLNGTGAHSVTVNYQLGQIPSPLGQPYPVFFSKWGLECFRAKQIKTFNYSKKKSEKSLQI